MERGSDKHSPRVDEALQHEIGGLMQSNREGRAEEFREQEGPAEGEPTPDAVVRTIGDSGFSLGHDDLERRSDIARHLQPSVFPARPAALVESARAMFAPDWIVERLETLPEGVYDHFEAVWEALGGDEDFPRA